MKSVRVYACWVKSPPTKLLDVPAAGKAGAFFVVSIRVPERQKKPGEAGVNTKS